jgi:hypothetical protein
VTPVRAIDEMKFQVGPITSSLVEDFRALTRAQPVAAATARAS